MPKTHQEGRHDRNKEKGNHAAASSHEILGFITEEYDELTDAVRSNSINAAYAELVDIAVSAVFGMMSISQNKVDW